MAKKKPSMKSKKNGAAKPSSTESYTYNFRERNNLKRGSASAKGKAC